MRSAVLRVALGATITAAVGGALVAHAAPRSAGSATDGVVTLRTIDDAGTCAGDPKAETASDGTPCPTFDLYYASPAGKPRGLVVIFHGHGHNGEQYPAQLRQLADQDHVVAVAMATNELPQNPDGSYPPSYRGPFDSVDEEARDAAAAIGWARKRFHTGTHTYLLGVSMGGSGLAYFVDAATRPSTNDADATWVQSFHPLPLAGLVDAEGIATLHETWAEATAADPNSAAEIEMETGGTPADATAAYRSRSVALLPTSEWQATGLPVVGIVHDVDDGLVPYNQTAEARAAIAAAGIPVQTYDVVFKDSCAQGSQTTATSYVGLVPGFPSGSTEGALCLAGHASENDPQTPVMEAAVTALRSILAGNTGYDASVENPTHPG